MGGEPTLAWRRCCLDFQRTQSSPHFSVCPRPRPRPRSRCAPSSCIIYNNTFLIVFVLDIAFLQPWGCEVEAATTTSRIKEHVETLVGCIALNSPSKARFGFIIIYLFFIFYFCLRVWPFRAQRLWRALHENQERESKTRCLPGNYVTLRCLLFLRLSLYIFVLFFKN